MNNARRAYEAGIKLAYANFMSKLAVPASAQQARDDYDFTDADAIDVSGTAQPEVMADMDNMEVTTEPRSLSEREALQHELDQEIFMNSRDPKDIREAKERMDHRLNLIDDYNFTDADAIDVRGTAQQAPTQAQGQPRRSQQTGKGYAPQPPRETAQQLLARIQSRPRSTQQNLVYPTLNEYSDGRGGMQGTNAELITAGRQQADADTIIRGVRNSLAAGRPGIETMFGNLGRAMGTRFMDSVNLQTPRGQQINMNKGDVRTQYQGVAPQISPVPKSFAAQLPNRLPPLSPLNTGMTAAGPRVSGGVQTPIQPKPMSKLTPRVPNTGFMNNMQMKQIGRG